MRPFPTKTAAIAALSLASAFAGLLGAATLPAAAASPTARATGDVPVRLGPGSDYPIIGKLNDGSQVELQYCTRSGRWCLIAPNAGWVRASYLVGSAAKLRATPFSFSTDFPFSTPERD